MIVVTDDLVTVSGYLIQVYLAPGVLSNVLRNVFPTIFLRLGPVLNHTLLLESLLTWQENSSRKDAEPQRKRKLDSPLITRIRRMVADEIRKIREYPHNQCHPAANQKVLRWLTDKSHLGV